jgi:hypothetical protein
MSVISYNNFIDLFSEIANQHYQINRFGNGELSEADINTFITQSQQFPVLWVTPVNVSTNINTLIYTFNVMVFDIVDKDKLNQNDVISDCLQIELDILRILRYGNDQFDVIVEPTIEPFGGNYSEWVFGWNMLIEIEVPFQDNLCDISSDSLDLTSIIREIVIPDRKEFDCSDLDDCPQILSIVNNLGNLIISGNLDSNNGILTLTKDNGNTIDISGFTFSNSLSGLTDTLISNPTVNDILSYNGSEWVNIQFSGGTSSPNNPIFTKELLSGGAVWSGVGLDFDVSILSYRFYTENILFTNSATTVTLSSGDTTFDRIDAIVVDVDGNISVIEGTPSTTPATPNIPSNQLLVNFIIIGANQTTPQVNELVVYKENVEWTGSFDSGVGTVSFDNTVDPFQGTFATYADQINNLQRIRYTNSVNINPTTYQTLSFWVKLDTNPLPPIGTIQVNLALSGSVVGNTLNATAFGLNGSNTSNYQLVVIPVSFFGASNIDQVVFRPTSPNGSDLYSFYLDNIVFQDGTNPILGNNLTVKQSGATIDTNVNEINFIGAEVTSTSTGKVNVLTTVNKSIQSLTYYTNGLVKITVYDYVNGDSYEERFEYNVGDSQINKREVKDDLFGTWIETIYTWTGNQITNIVYTNISNWSII